MNHLRVIGQRLSTLPVSGHLTQRAFAAAATTPTDPIQRLFVEKIRQYAQKSKTAEMGLVDANADTKKALSDLLEKIDNQFQAKGQDMTKFPAINFQDPEVTNPGSSIDLSKSS